MDEVRYARAVRPFPLRKLTASLAALHRRCGYIAEVTAELVAAEGEGPVRWRYWLGELMDCIDSLVEEAQAVREELSRSYDSAPADYERAVDAMLVILRGLQSEWRDAAEAEA